MQRPNEKPFSVVVTLSVFDRRDQRNGIGVFSHIPGSSAEVAEITPQNAHSEAHRLHGEPSREGKLSLKISYQCCQLSTAFSPTAAIWNVFGTSKLTKTFNFQVKPEPLQGVKLLPYSQLEELGETTGFDLEGTVKLVSGGKSIEILL